MTGNKGAGLTSQQLADYRDNGFCFPIAVMDEADIRQHLDSLTALEAQFGPMHYRVKPYLIVRSAYKIATNPLLLDTVESVLGPDILLWDGSYVIKEPHTRKFVSWHQDLRYWGLELESYDDIVSAWVALTPATQRNGCMRFVRGSHRAGEFDHEDTFDDSNILHRGQSIAAEFDASVISQIELAPGQASLHQGWAVHSSNPNSSDMRRVGLVLNYIKPSARQAVGIDETATLVRGSDAFGNFAKEPACDGDFAPGNVEFQRNVEAKKREVYDTA